MIERLFGSDTARAGSEGSIYTALIAVILFTACALIERGLLQNRVAAYFAVGLPIGETRPIPTLPDRLSGKTEHTEWTRDDERLLFVGVPGRRAPWGLHGRVDLVRGDAGINLVGRYLPPLTPFIALVWLLGLGAVRGDLLLVVPLVLVAATVVFWMHRRTAALALDEIRAALVQG